MKRNNLTKIVDKVNTYFDYLESELLELPSTIIFNCDESNLTEDPCSKTVIVSQGRRRVQSIMEHSKTAEKCYVFWKCCWQLPSSNGGISNICQDGTN